MKEVLLPTWRDELAEQESQAQEAREVWHSDHSNWATELRQSEGIRKRLEQELSAVQHQIIGMKPRINGFESANAILRKRMQSQQAQIARYEGSRTLEELEDVTVSIAELQARCVELEAARRKVKTSPREVSSQSTASSAATPSDRLASVTTGADAANGDVRSRVPDLPEEEQAQAVSAAANGDPAPEPWAYRQGSPEQSAPAEPDTLVTQSRHIALNSRVEELLLDFSIKTGVAKPHGPASPPIPAEGTPTEELADTSPGRFRFPGSAPQSVPSLQVPPLRNKKGSGGGGSRQGSPTQSPGRSPGQTARSTVSRSNSPRVNGLTPAQAASRWRQRMLSQHDVERQNLQERMEQMRRHVSGRLAERQAA